MGGRGDRLGERTRERGPLGGVDLDRVLVGREVGRHDVGAVAAAASLSAPRITARAQPKISSKAWPC
eukprot:618018-Lingulodinium_polyedra.AAC.1